MERIICASKPVDVSVVIVHIGFSVIIGAIGWILFVIELPPHRFLVVWASTLLNHDFLCLAGRLFVTRRCSARSTRPSDTTDVILCECRSPQLPQDHCPSLFTFSGSEDLSYAPLV